MGAPHLLFANLAEPGFDPFYKQLTSWLSERTGFRIECLTDEHPSVRRAMLDNGAVHMASICGLGYIRRHINRPRAQHQQQLSLICAPVMRAERYNRRPVYYTDLVINKKSGFKTFADLKGTTIAFDGNESHSSYNQVRYHLAKTGEVDTYFRKSIATGSHLKSINMVLEGVADVTPRRQQDFGVPIQQRP